MMPPHSTKACDQAREIESMQGWPWNAKDSLTKIEEPITETIYARIYEIEIHRMKEQEQKEVAHRLLPWPRTATPPDKKYNQKRNKTKD